MNEFKVSLAKAQITGLLNYSEIDSMKGKVAKRPVSINRENIQEFFNLVGKEHCVFCPSTFKNGVYRKENFEQIQLFALYFNTTRSSEKKKVSHYDIIERANKLELPVLFAYDVFSHELLDPKSKSFCVAFLLSHPIFELRTANVVQKALMTIFPEADSSCSVLKIYNGGNKKFYLDRELPEIELEWLFMKMCFYLREKYGSTNFRRKIAEFSKDTGIILNRKGYPVISIVEPERFNKDILIFDTNTYQNNKKLPKPILNNIGFGENLLKLTYQVIFNNENDNDVHSGKENGRTSYRSDSLKSLSHSCRLYQDFQSGERELNNMELFGLASNLSQIEAGRNKFMTMLKATSNAYRKKDAWFFQLGYLKNRDERPCSSFCPYHIDCPHGKTILSTVKPKYHQIERIENYDDNLVNLDEAHADFTKKFVNAVESSKNVWHIIRAQTAIGKTEVILQLLMQFSLNVLIAVPTNKLKHEECERAKELGIDIIASPSLHELKENLSGDLWDDIEEMYSAGKSPMTVINKANYQLEEKDTNILNQYKKDLNNFYNQNCAITTHRRLTKMNLEKFDLVIVDEDIIYSTVIPNRVSVNISDIKRLKKKVSSKSPLKNKIKKILKAIEYQDFFTLDKIDYDDLYNDIEVGVNISALCSAQYFCYRKVSAGESELTEDCITFIEPIDFPKNKKFIMLSATVNQELCEQYFGVDNVTFYQCKEAVITGNLHQYGEGSKSRSVMRKDATLISRIKQWTGVKNTISFKEFEHLYNGDQHFGNCVGCDNYKGKDLDVIGTPHQPEWIYKLFAYSLGFDIDVKLKPQTIVVNNGFRFRFTTYDDLMLRCIQFYMIETELEQAVGRARLLRCDCTVNLFSDYPLRQAVQMVSEYDIR